jgi:hypothetical protein
MTKRNAFLPRAALVAASILAGTWITAGNAADTQAPKNWKLARTIDGHPDMQGIWTSATLTRLERPSEFGDRLVLTPEEARKIEGAEATYVENAAKPSDLNKPNPDCSNFQFGCGYNNFWIDRGSQVVTINGEKRSSLIIDPPNGRVPGLNKERQAALASQRRGRSANDGPETRTLSDRCLLAFGSSSGPPMLPVLYNNHYQIVQSKDTVVILVEMIHDARVIRLGGKHVPVSVRKWMGDSIGRWEGDTLVVETTNFTSQQSFRGSTENLKVTERFTVAGPGLIHYRFTVDDPGAFTQSFTGELPLYRTDEQIYEYACHEGNYAMPGILAGAREQEKSGVAPAPAAPARDEE